MRPEKSHRRPCEIPDRHNAETVQLLLRRASHIQQIAHRQFPGRFLIIRGRNDGHGIRLFHVAAQFCKHLVVRNADGDRDAEFRADSGPDLMCHALRILKVFRAGRDVDPVLIESEALHAIGILRIDLPSQLGKPVILRKIRRDRNKARTLLLCLPDRLARTNAVSLGDLVLCKDNAVTRRRVARDSDRSFTDGRVEQTGYRRIKAVEIRMQDPSFHPA